LERKLFEALLYVAGVNCHLRRHGAQVQLRGLGKDGRLRHWRRRHGAGIARDAAGRGLKVALLEQGDLAAGTSSASSKLIHGGLRYLEHGALRLLRAGRSASAKCCCPWRRI
jgi:hypothetical protein